MNKHFTSLGLFTLLSFHCYAQEVDSLINLGNKYRENGNYQQAITEYSKALKFEKRSPIANFEMAYAYVKIENYKEALKYCNRALRTESERNLDAIIIKGSVLDYMGKSKKSIKLYRSALKRFPNSGLLHYNLGITYYNNNQLTLAKDHIIKSIEIDKLQANSHYVLGLLMNDLGCRIESMMSLYFFLLLEPNTERSVESLKMLKNLWEQNIVFTSSNKQIITTYHKNDNCCYNSADLLLSEIYAHSKRNNQFTKNDYDIFISNTSSFFKLLDSFKGTELDIRQNLYINLFTNLFYTNQVEPFCYYISTTCDDIIINSWLESNRDKIESFSVWANNQLIQK